VSYRVDNRSEARERLEDFEREHGIDGVDDIRRAHGSRRHRIDAAGETGQLGLQAGGAPGELTADYAALANAHRALSSQLEKLDGLIADATRLARPLNDGHGPIAHAVSSAFAERVEDADGAVRALVGYRTELGNVVAAIERTMAQYQRVDTDLADYLATIGERYA